MTVLATFLTKQELARQLGVSPRTIDRWHLHRKGPPRTRCGRKILYDQQKIAVWLESCTETDAA